MSQPRAHWRIKLQEGRLYVLEFSKINHNAGRDHQGWANCVLLAGAGIPAGLVLGKTDARGDNPTDRPVTAADLSETAEVITRPVWSLDHGGIRSPFVCAAR